MHQSWSVVAREKQRIVFTKEMLGSDGDLENGSRVLDTDAELAAIPCSRGAFPDPPKTVA